jgi:Cys-tRNA synthase (O-phospho-L-seryl-tRNA:Cys-tRNA synthase)
MTEQESYPINQELEQKIESIFAPLWDRGVLGVKVIQNEETVKVSAYLLNDLELEDVPIALEQVAEDFRDQFQVEESIIRGIVPINRITLSVAA